MDTKVIVLFFAGLPLFVISEHFTTQCSNNMFRKEKQIKWKNTNATRCDVREEREEIIIQWLGVRWQPEKMGYLAAEKNVKHRPGLDFSISDPNKHKDFGIFHLAFIQTSNRANDHFIMLTFVLSPFNSFNSRLLSL